MARQNTNTRPEPRFENGYFIPSAPIPDPRNIEDFKWYHGFETIPKIANNPIDTFNHSQFKDPVTQYKIFANNFSVINDPAIIKHCFVDNRSNYRLGAIRQRLLRSILGDGIITSEGEKWKHARQAMSPMFTPRNVKHFASVMKTTTEREMDNLFAVKGPIKISQPMATLTYLVLSDTLFSGDIDRGQGQIIEDVATALLHLGRPDPLDIFNAPTWIPRLTRLKGTKAVANLRDMIGTILRKRKAEKAKGHELPDDFLTRLLSVGSNDERAFSDIEIEDQLLAFIGAGHETTARALANSILFINTWILHRHETLWVDPEMFKPDRFLGDARANIDRFQYLPFGVGERVCIGQRFAMQEAAILMAVIAKTYRFDYASDEAPWPKMRITIQPENGMPMRITKR